MIEWVNDCTVICAPHLWFLNIWKTYISVSQFIHWVLFKQIIHSTGSCIIYIFLRIMGSKKNRYIVLFFSFQSYCDFGILTLKFKLNYIENIVYFIIIYNYITIYNIIIIICVISTDVGWCHFYCLIVNLKKKTLLIYLNLFLKQLSA